MPFYTFIYTAAESSNFDHFLLSFIWIKMLTSYTFKSVFVLYLIMTMFTWTWSIMMLKLYLVWLWNTDLIYNFLFLFTEKFNIPDALRWHLWFFFPFFFFFNSVIIVNLIVVAQRCQLWILIIISSAMLHICDAQFIPLLQTALLS